MKALAGRRDHIVCSYEAKKETYFGIPIMHVSDCYLKPEVFGLKKHFVI